ncbi:MAG: OmpA family protein [Acidibrevibacterium sp.]|jgi:chemotaxis protein MotB|uniref:flagellar motor protein MotB n=1 Tax=Acidibrevibacterium fodinaquatile TaxID=1969806 RepID=UPI0023A7EEA3|nr:flagellar motor protein MotB [Acidibrevibacterium fodinaquatile]MCA7120160.1 OmpA family protein [Acidibrevibacterium fodinaquatile]
MAGKSGKNGENANKIVLIRKEEVIEGGHHGGAWKVAYADFVTAMMAFFLLMWLINATTEAQRRGLADYFSKSNIFSHQTSGSGKPFGGKTPFEDGSMVSDRGAEQVVTGNADPVQDVDEDNGETPAHIQPDPNQNDDLNPGGKDLTGSGNGLPGNTLTFRADDGKPGRGDSGPAAPGGQAATAPQTPQAALAKQGTNIASAASSPPVPPAAAKDADPRKAEEASFQQAAREIRAAIASDPALRDLARQLAIDETPEGLRIQILDEDKRPMFDLGASAPNGRARDLLAKITPVLNRLPERLSIGGYTDAAPYRGGGKSNWDLSTERANATRRFLAEAGLPEDRFQSVTGHADRELLLPGDPLAAANRRIAIMVLRTAGPRKAAPQPASAVSHPPADDR